MLVLFFFFFFFNDTATTEIYTLSLHDALPICPPPVDCKRTAWDCGREGAASRRSQARSLAVRRTARQPGSREYPHAKEILAATADVRAAARSAYRRRLLLCDRRRRHVDG